MSVPATVSLMSRDEITVHASSSPDAKTFRSRNQTSALNEGRRSHLGKSALNITLYLIAFLPAGRLHTRNAIAMHRALSREAMENVEPSDRRRPEKLATTNRPSASARFSNIKPHPREA